MLPPCDPRDEEPDFRTLNNAWAAFVTVCGWLVILTVIYS